MKTPAPLKRDYSLARRNWGQGHSRPMSTLCKQASKQMLKEQPVPTLFITLMLMCVIMLPVSIAIPVEDHTGLTLGIMFSGMTFFGCAASYNSCKNRYQ